MSHVTCVVDVYPYVSSIWSTYQSMCIHMCHLFGAPMSRVTCVVHVIFMSRRFGAPVSHITHVHVHLYVSSI